MLGHVDSACDMEDLPAMHEKALADAGTPPAKSGSVNLWCLLFDVGANLPAPGCELPKPYDVKSSAGAVASFGAAGGGRAR